MSRFLQRLWGRIDDNMVKVLAAVIALTITIIVLWPLSVVFIPAGHVGVLWSRFFGGTITDRVYQEGTRVLFPWDVMNIYDARFQLIERDFDVLTSDGLRSTVNIAFRFRIDDKSAGLLHKLVGPDYLNVLLVSDVGSQARHVFAKYIPEEAFTDKRTEIENLIRDGVDKNLLENFNPADMSSVRFVVMEDVLIRGVQFPPSVADAIERKRVESNRAQQYVFSIQAERREAERKEIEAGGIRAFQDIIRDGLTDNYLRWRGIEATLQLAQSHNSKVVIIGSGPGGLPIILGNMDDRGPAPAGPMSLPLTPGALSPPRMSAPAAPPPSRPPQSTPQAPVLAPSGASGTPPAVLTPSTAGGTPPAVAPPSARSGTPPAPDVRPNGSPAAR